MKTWAQSFLAGVQHVLFAYRDDDGNILKTQTFKTLEFPRMARSENLWDPNRLLTFGSKALDFIQENMKQDDITYRIAFDPPSKEITIEIDENQEKII